MFFPGNRDSDKSSTSNGQHEARKIDPNTTSIAGEDQSVNNTEAHLDEDVLKLIGDRVREMRTLGPAIDADFVVRWDDIIKQGLCRLTS